MFGKMFNEKGHVMLKKSVYLMATISVLGWVTLAGADDFVEDFESYEVHAFLDSLPNWTTVVFGAANTEVTGGDYFIDDINGSKRLHSPRGGATIAVINADVVTLAAGADFELSVDMMWIGNGIGNGLIFNYQDQGNFYYLEIISPQRGDTGFHLKKQEGGGSQTLVSTAPADLAVNTEYRLHVQYKAGPNTFEVSLETLDDGIVVQAFEGIVDDTFRGGQIGVWANASFTGQFDNLTLVEPATIAVAPNPANQASDIARDLGLSWTPSDLASTHDVYFGTQLVDVNDASRTDPREVLVSQGQSDTSFDPAGRFDFGQTYFWRVDEVNGPPDFTLFKGGVWQFTAEPVGYPIENIAVTASSENRATEGPGNTINGSGLDDDGLHSSESTDMWLTSMMDPNPAWIQFEFDRSYKLYQMLVWNYNSTVEPAVGFGIKEATIEYSVDGANFSVLGTTHEFAQGPGQPGYASNTAVDLSGVTARYVRITANSNWSPYGLNQFGLSEVRILYIPVWPTEPSPDPGATDVDVNAVLSFRAGREAARHDVYLSTDEQAVINGTAPVETVTEPSYASSLDLASTYYWRIDEVNDSETPTTWQGDIWNLSTQEYLVVEDFESYNDIEAGQEGSNLIYETWPDGFGVAANGSTIGYTVPFEPTMETSVVYDGSQSVPFSYDNTVATYSEVTTKLVDLQVSPDWTGHAIKALTLRFSGDPTNVAQQMYVKLNGAKVAYDGSAENTRLSGWQMWYIDLASIGVDLGNVTELAIGFERIGASGGQGVVLLDAIRLYSYDRQLITPAEPGIAGLQAHYEFEGNTNDSSGNARHGVGMSTTFVAGKIGQAVNLDGLDYVGITGYKGVLGANAITVTAWISTISTDTGEIVGWGPNVAGERFTFRVDAGRLRMEHAGGNVQGDTSVNDGAWHHVAVTIQENATISYPEVILYLNGADDTRPTTDTDPVFNLTAAEDVSIGRRPSVDDRYFIGQIDEVRIYDRALTQEEVTWLAGRIQPFDKPF